MPPARGKRPKQTTKQNKVSVPKRRKMEPPPNDPDSEASEDEAAEGDDDQEDPVTEVMKGFDRQPLTLWHVSPIKNFDYSERKIRSLVKRLEQQLVLLASSFRVNVEVLKGIAAENDDDGFMINIHENMPQMSKKGRTLTCIFGSSGLKNKSKHIYLPIMVAKGKDALVKSVDVVFRTFYESTIVPLGLDRASTVQSLSAYWLYRMMRYSDAEEDKVEIVLHGKLRSDQVTITLQAGHLSCLTGDLKKVRMRNVWSLLIEAVKEFHGFGFDTSISIISVRTPTFYVSVPKYGNAKVKLSIADRGDVEYVWSALTHLSRKLNPEIA